MKYKIERGNGRIVVTFEKAPSQRTSILLKGLGYKYYPRWKCWIGQKNFELLEEMLEHRAVENERIQKVFHRKSSICWGCDKCTGLCPWSHDFSPVYGWEAIPMVTDGQNTYLIEKCPLFKQTGRK